MLTVLDLYLFKPCQKGISEGDWVLIAHPRGGTVEEEGAASPWLFSQACEPKAELLTVHTFISGANLPLRKPMWMSSG